MFLIVSAIGCFDSNSVAQEEGLEFKPKTVINRPFPAIKNVKHVDLAEADKTIDDDELVIGVEHKGQTIAYPINMLTGPRREIINDKLGGDFIAATW